MAIAGTLVIGGAGFIGSHVVRRLAGEGHAITVYDNFSSGRMWRLGDLAQNVKIVQEDVKDLGALTAAMQGAEWVVHLASNPDISKAMTEPAIDFWEGTYLTHNVVEAMRQSGATRLIYASGSGVYGESGNRAVAEDNGGLTPISTYGASKLAGEAEICAYCHMFGLRAAAFRFANVVGPRQSHGVGYDFVLRLLRDPATLRILGDGSQSKSYLHVEDAIEAMLHVARAQTQPFEYFNAASGDYITVNEIADLVVQRMGLSGVNYHHTGGDRGWKGDVPVVRFNCDKLLSRGWKPRRNSREAMTDAVDSMINDAKAGKLSAP